MKIKNLNLLVQRLEQQLDSPEAARFNMAAFGSKYWSGLTGILPEFAPVCKTQACLAGESVLSLGIGEILPDGGIASIESGYMLSGVEIKEEATKVLGLTQVQATRLFYFKKWVAGRKEGWPEVYQIMYEKAKTPQGRLYAAILRVKHFIATKGRE